MVRRKHTYFAQGRIYDTGTKRYSQRSFQNDQNYSISNVNESSSQKPNNNKKDENNKNDASATISMKDSLSCKNINYNNDDDNDEDDYYNDYDESFKPPTKKSKIINSKQPQLFIKTSIGKANLIAIKLKCICGSQLVKSTVSSDDEWNGKISCDRCKHQIPQRRKAWCCKSNKLEQFVQWHGWYWQYNGTQWNTLLRSSEDWTRLSSGYALCFKCIKELYPKQYSLLSKRYKKNEYDRLSNLINLS